MAAPTASRPRSIMVQVAGSGMGMVGGVPGGPSGGGPPGGVPPGGVPPGGVPPGGVPPGGVPSGGNPGGGGPGYRKGVLEKGGPKAGGPVNWSAGGEAGLDPNAGGTAEKMGLSVPGGRAASCGRSRTVESTRSRGPFFVDSSAPGARSPGERSEKSESGSCSAAKIISLLTLLRASRPCPTAKTDRPINKGASKNARLRLALSRAARR